VAQSRKEIISEIKKTLTLLAAPDAYFRLIITRGEGDIGLDPTLAKRSNLVIIARAFRNNPEWWYEKGVNLIIPNIERNAKRSTDPNIKSGNYLNNVLAYMEAKKLGAYDALMLNAQGHVTEGTTNNIWFVCNNELYTPDLSVGLLKGITREMILHLTQQLGLKVSQGAYTVEKLKTASEAFLTSSTREIVPVVKIDDWSVGDGKPGAITKKVHQAYRQFVQAHLRANQNW
jgi:branched-chain amino acid aminotransferase